MKDECYLYDLKTGKELRKFPLEIGTMLEIRGRKKDNFVIIFPTKFHKIILLKN